MIAIGRLGRPHGVRGEIKLFPYFGHDLVDGFIGRRLYVKAGKEPEMVTLVSSRAADKLSIVAFDGIGSPEDVAKYSGGAIQVPRESMPPPTDGTYYYEEIVGLPVFDPEGRKLGVLTDFFEAGSADVWVVKSDTGEEIMTPCIPETLVEVDLPGGRIVMKLMEIE
ncbi:MAG: ribosome maturation factor RimM [Nitrospinota bacterium]|nr:ribosome maturation factor RimM [Nitrospinota bacterium]